MEEDGAAPPPGLVPDATGDHAPVAGELMVLQPDTSSVDRGCGRRPRKMLSEPRQIAGDVGSERDSVSGGEPAKRCRPTRNGQTARRQRWLGHASIITC